MKAENIAMFIITGCIIIFICLGSITFCDGYESDDPLQMCGGLGLMLISWITLLVITQALKNQSLEQQIEELKTDLALLQNRIDWIEDDICKEYKEE